MSETLKVEATFYDNYVPSIQSGKYTLTASQSLKSDNPKVESPPQPPVSQTFIVRGPRFILDPADIHRAFPPPTSTGVWVDFLPMIVFNKRSLPWERRLPFAVPNADRYPWVALLVFSQDELRMPQGEPDAPNSQANPARITPFPLDDVVHSVWKGKPTKGPPAGIIGPTIELADDEDPNEIQVNTIEIAAKTFADLMPTVKDLGCLAHVREVSTENKEPQNAVHDGWYSALIGNRFGVPPKAGKDEALPVTNVVHVVSLEGLERYIGVDAPLAPPGPVRLISLYSWVYTSLPVPQENLRELMLNLISESSKQGTDLLLRLPVENPSDAQTDTEKSVVARLQNGYLPLSYRTLTGEATFAWYRGPLSPVVTKPFLETPGPVAAIHLEAPRNTSEAMVYDPVTGLFEQSYAVAFQTGRSLALADLPFATSLHQWRREAHAAVDRLMEYTRSPHLRGILQGLGILDGSGSLTAADAGSLSKLLDANLISNAFLGYLATEFGHSLAMRVGRVDGFTAADAERTSPSPPAPRPPEPSDLADLMQRPAVVSLLRQMSGLEVPEAAGQHFAASILPDHVVEWLTQTALLYGVPFDNLVPSVRMLPEESIRFFYIDSNWIAALLDGALSVAIQSSRDALLQRLMRDPLQRAVKGVVHQVRERLRKVAVTRTAAPVTTMAGFVLRSAIVSGWQGLEVRGFSDPDRTQPIKPVRLDRISPNVLIVIFPEVPVAIELNEPSEGLAFGREAAGISLRYLPGAGGAKPGNIGELIEPPVWLPPAAIDALRRPEPPGTGALRIAGADGLVHALETRFRGSPPTLSPASLAVEMVKTPEQMLFLPVQENGGQ